MFMQGLTEEVNTEKLKLFFHQAQGIVLYTARISSKYCIYFINNFPKTSFTIPE